MSRLQPFTQLPIGTLPPLQAFRLPVQQRRAAPPQGVTAEEESTLLGSVISGAAAVGNVLDLPGSVVRDVIGGQNPFDQFLTPFSHENRVTGRELLRGGGLIGGRDTWKNFAGGLAAEIALDPLTLLTGPLGTLAAGSKIGVKAAGKGLASVGNLNLAIKAADKAADTARASAKGAKQLGPTISSAELLKTAAKETANSKRMSQLSKALSDDPAKALATIEGNLDDAKLLTLANTTPGARAVDYLPNTPAAIADQIRAGERGAIGLRIPFTKTQLASLGVGSERAAKAVEAAFYADKGLAGVANIPIRALRSLFSSTAGGVVQGTAQRARDIAAAERVMMHSAIQTLSPSITKAQTELLQGYKVVAENHKQIGDAAGFARFTKLAIEQKGGLQNADDVLNVLKDHLEITGDIGLGEKNFADLTYKFLDTMRETEDAMFGRVIDLGMNTKVLDDLYIEHGLGRAKTGAKRTQSEFWRPREEILRGMPDGTSGVNRLVMHRFVSGTKHLSTEERGVLKGEIRKWLSEEGGRLEGVAGAAVGGTPASGAKTLESATQTAAIGRSLKTASKVYGADVVEVARPSASKVDKRLEHIAREWSGTAEALVKLTGLRPVYFSGDIAAAGWVVPSIKNTVFLNEELGSDSLALVLHEATHDWQRAHPARYAELESLLIPKKVTSAIRRYADKVKKWSPPGAYKRFMENKAKSQSEGVASIIGNLLDFRTQNALTRASSPMRKYIMGTGNRDDAISYFTFAITPSSTNPRRMAEIIVDILDEGRGAARATEQTGLAQAVSKLPAAKGIAVSTKATLGELQNLFIEHYSIRPGLDKAWPDKGLTRLHRGKEVTYQQQLEEWLTPSQRIKPDGTTTSQTRIDRLRKFLNRRPKSELKSGLFSESSITEWSRYMDEVVARESVMVAAHAMMKQKGALIKGLEGGRVSLSKAWGDAGFTNRGLETLMGDMGKSLDDVANLSVEPEVAGALKSFAAAQDPRKLGEIAKGWDRLTALYKGALTTPWPAFHTRNLASGYWQSVSDGKINPMKIAGGYSAAYTHITGGKKLTYLDEFVHNGGLKGQGEIVDVVGEEAATQLGDVLPKGGLSSILRPFASLGRPSEFLGAVNPAAFRGVKKHVTDVVPGTEKLNALAQAGENAYKIVEFVNRAGYYEALRKDGYTAAQSLYFVKRSQFDYNELSRFEKDWARKIGPLFYGWLRKSVPFTVQKILERPGGITSQTIRGFNVGQRESPGYIPSFLKERLALPWGTQDPETGAQTFLTDPGIPIGDLNIGVFGKRGLDIGRTAQKAASQLHPLISAPIEQAAGKQFFSGRNLKDLQSTTERLFGIAMPIVDRLLAIGPWSRAVHELTGKPFDARKTILQRIVNQLTGFKSSTYDSERWKAIDAAAAIREALVQDPRVGQGHYDYVRKRYRDTITPEITHDIRRATSLQQWISLHVAAEKARELNTGVTV